MGIQNFKFQTDFMNNLENPVIYIAKKNKKILSSITNYENLRFDFNLNAFHTLTFDVYKSVNNKSQDCYNYLEEDMLVLALGICWYKIHVETTIDAIGRKKSVSGTSLECTLCGKRLIDFECNAGEILYDDYVRTIFYDPSNPKGSLLHRVLNICPNWTIGHVDDSLANKQRSFDIDDTDVYSFLTGEVSEAFNCLFIFDTFNCTVNAYDLDTYGKNANIFISIENFAKQMTETIDENSIFTCYRVNGGDGVYINEVNPNGTNKIYNFEYYLPKMEESLQNKVISYNNKFQELKPQYEAIMLKMQTEVDIIQELNTRLPSDLNSTNWSEYGLAMLEIIKKSYENQDTIYKSMGMNDPSSLSYNAFLTNQNLLNSVTAEYNKRQGEINTEMVKYDAIKEERNELQSQLDMDKWFTEDEWKELDSYIIEQTYTNDNYIVTDLENDSERFDIERQLYDTAWKDLSKKCRPQYQYSSTLYNILTIPEFKDFLPYFELGNFIYMRTDYENLIKMRIIHFSVDFSNTETIDVTFSDAIRVKSVYEDAASIIAQANSAAMSFQFNKDQYDKSVNESNFVRELRKYGLDVATTKVMNARNQSQVWDETGMTFRQWNNERQDYDPEQIKIINNLIVFSDDGFQNGSKMALGKINLGNGEYAYGLNAEVILGDLIMSRYLHIENASGTYKFDDNGFIAKSKNGLNTIKIMPGNDGELFSLYKGNKKNFYIDNNGNIAFAGNLIGATGTFSGLLSGGSINIGNGTFMVDENGKVTATSGSFKGDITGSTGTFSGLLSGGSIDIGNGTFTVDPNGNMIATSGMIGGFNIANDSLSASTSDRSKFTILSPYFYQNYCYNYGDGKVYETTILDGKITTNSITIRDYISLPYVPATCTYNSNTNEYAYGVRIYSIENEGTGGNIGIPSAGWVKCYTAKHYATKSHTHSGYANSNHSHSNYVSSANYSYTDSNTTKYSPRVFSRSGNTLNITGYSISTSGSDARIKDNICDLPNSIYDFYMDLKPQQYNFKEGYISSHRGNQFGLIAQQTLDLLEKYNIDSGLVTLERAEEDEKAVTGDDYLYHMDYQNLHAMHVYMIQKQQKELDKIEKRISELENCYKKME